MRAEGAPQLLRTGGSEAAAEPGEDLRRMMLTIPCCALLRLSDPCQPGELVAGEHVGRAGRLVVSEMTGSTNKINYLVDAACHATEISLVPSRPSPIPVVAESCAG
jgi:hypothetical protein